MANPVTDSFNRTSAFDVYMGGAVDIDDWSFAPVDQPMPDHCRFIKLSDTFTHAIRLPSIDVLKLGHTIFVCAAEISTATVTIKNHDGDTLWTANAGEKRNVLFIRRASDWAVLPLKDTSSW